MRIENLTVLIADKDKVLVDGNDYSETTILPKGRAKEEFGEITREEYNKIMSEQEAQLDM